MEADEEESQFWVRHWYYFSIRLPPREEQQASRGLGWIKQKPYAFQKLPCVHPSLPEERIQLKSSVRTHSPFCAEPSKEPCCQNPWAALFTRFQRQKEQQRTRTSLGRGTIFQMWWTTSKSQKLYIWRNDIANAAINQAAYLKMFHSVPWCWEPSANHSTLPAKIWGTRGYFRDHSAAEFRIPSILFSFLPSLSQFFVLSL